MIPISADKEPHKAVGKWGRYVYGPRPGLETVLRWFEAEDVTGLALLARDGVCFLDDDRQVAPPAGKDKLGQVIGADLLVAAPRRKGAKGSAWVFRTQDGYNPGNLNMKANKIELKVRRMYLVVPPSIHPDTGEPYMWMGAPRLGPIGDLPVLPYAVMEALHRVVAGKPSKREQLRTARSNGQAPSPHLLHDETPAKFDKIGKWGGNPAELQRIAEAVTFVPADEYDVWLKVGSALKHYFGDAGRPLWDAWSGGGAFLGYAYPGSVKFDLVVQDAKWRASLDGISLGTIVYIARANGWNASLARWPTLIGRAFGGSNILEIAAYMPLGHEPKWALLSYARSDSRLGLADRDALGALLDYDNQRVRVAWPSTATLADRLGLTEKTVRLRMEKLCRIGYLVRDPVAHNPDDTVGCWAFTPPDGMSWADLVFLYRVETGHTYNTAGKGLGALELDEAAAAKGEEVAQRKAPTACPGHGAEVDLVDLSDLGETARTAIERAAKGGRASDVLGQHRESIPAKELRKIDQMALGAARLLAKLRKAFDAIETVIANAIALAKRKGDDATKLVAEPWAQVLPERVRQAVQRCAASRRKVKVHLALSATLRGAIGDIPLAWKPIEPDLLRTVIEVADRRLGWDWKTGCTIDLGRISAAKLVGKFHHELLAELVRRDLKAPGVYEYERGQEAIRKRQAKRRSA